MTSVKSPVARTWRLVAVILGVLCLLALAFYFLPILLTLDSRPTNPVDVLAAQNAVRATAVAALVAAGTATASTIAWRSLALNRLGHMTDRYTKSVSMLGEDKMELRLGGVYALEALSKDSPQHASMIAEVLSAFIRSYPVTLDPSDAAPVVNSALHASAPADVVAALKVIARRGLVASDGNRLDLRGSNLCEIELSTGTLSRARLHRCDLTGVTFLGVAMEGLVSDAADWRLAVLDKSDLKDARLDGSRLQGASLSMTCLAGIRIRHSDLTGANLHSAFLEGADLRGSILRGARLDKACLKDSVFDGADLTGAVLLGAALNGASLRGTCMTGAHLTRGSLSSGQLQDSEGAESILWT